jgi:uncharacterized hydrophobic protein (TIGR00271 family)
MDSMDQENRFNTWLSKYIKPLSKKRRTEIIDDIRTAASPGFDYFFLVVLSAAMATIGLINDSAAVIIGAMVVAPLMSPILGVGLGSTIADPGLTRDSAAALIRGALLSILLAVLITLFNIYLPFSASLLEIPKEIMTRTQPTPNDLMIALAGGLAAAYSLSQPHLSAALPGVAIATALMPPLSVIGIGIALGRWDVAGGATLLFLTNAITIAFAAILVFFLEGFVPRFQRNNQKIPKSLLITGVLTMLLLIPLTFLGVRLVSNAQENRLISNVINAEFSDIQNAEMIELSIQRSKEEINLDITVRSNTPLTYEQVLNLQENLVANLNEPVSLIVNHISSDTFDPLIPPTLTLTPTLGPSPTKTGTPTPTMVPPTRTPLPPTSTPTTTPTPILPSPTPITAIVISSGSAPPYYYLYQEPGGPMIARLAEYAILLDLHETTTYDGLIWVKVQDEDGRIGWYPKRNLFYPTPTITD